MFSRLILSQGKIKDIFSVNEGVMQFSYWRAKGFFSLVRGQRAFFQRYRRGHILLKNLAFECCVLAKGPGFNHQQTPSPYKFTKANITHLRYVYMVHVPLLLVFAKNSFKSKMLHDVMLTFHLRMLLFLIYVH